MTQIALKAAHFAAVTLNNPFGIGSLSLALVVVPIIGMHYVHKYGWQHWAPFNNESHT
jgi:hypothetical protein